jgi:hypothetical protein
MFQTNTRNVTEIHFTVAANAVLGWHPVRQDCETCRLKEATQALQHAWM